MSNSRNSIYIKIIAGKHKDSRGYILKQEPGSMRVCIYNNHKKLIVAQIPAIFIQRIPKSSLLN